MVEAPGKPSAEMDINYIVSLERKLAKLGLDLEQTRKELGSANNRRVIIEEQIPNSNIISTRYLERAFAVWGQLYYLHIKPNQGKATRKPLSNWEL